MGVYYSLEDIRIPYGVYFLEGYRIPEDLGQIPSDTRHVLT